MFRRHNPSAENPSTPSDEHEINFAAAILQGRNARDVDDSEVLQQAERLLSGWMNGQHKMERPKLYDHYALVLAAMLRRIQTLEARIEKLEQGDGQ